MSLNHKSNRIPGGFVSPLTVKFVCSKEKGHHENTKILKIPRGLLMRFMFFLVISYFRDFVIKELFLFVLSGLGLLGYIDFKLLKI